jgi:protein-L-isoaspartate(D-aspartate) O-methyltransferase
MLSDSQRARERMITGQLETNKITDASVIAAMRIVPREFFVPIDFAGSAYVDEEIPLGAGRMLLEPLVLATLLQGLQLKGSERVLIIGGAMGYSAAVLSHLVSELVMVEEQAALVQHARATLPLLGIRNVEVAQCALFDPSVNGKVDAILIEGAVQEIPEHILDLLPEGGRIAYVENRDLRRDGLKGAATGLGVLTVAVRRDGALTASRLTESGVTLLPGFTAVPRFAFA